MSEICTIPTISITPSSITIYNTWIGQRKVRIEDSGDEMLNYAKDPKNSEAWERRLENLRDNTHNGVMSEKAKKKCENAVKWLLFLSRNKVAYDRSLQRNVKFKICFVTVTLASRQMHPDVEIKSKLWNQLLLELKQSFNMQHYIWRAEKQSNGNIHFHLLTNVYIPQDQLRKKWNRIQNKLGYVDRYSEMMREKIHSFSDYYNQFIDQGTYTQLMQRYIKAKATGFRNPNSTDIHSVSKVKNIAAYLTKYLTKSEPKTGAKDVVKKYLSVVNGKLWGLSTSLSKLKTITKSVDSQLAQDINKLIDKFKKEVFFAKYFTFMRVSFKMLIQNKCESIMKYVYNELNKYNLNALCFTN